MSSGIADVLVPSLGLWWGLGGFAHDWPNSLQAIAFLQKCEEIWSDLDPIDRIVPTIPGVRKWAFLWDFGTKSSKVHSRLDRRPESVYPSVAVSMGWEWYVPTLWCFKDFQSTVLIKSLRLPYALGPCDMGLSRAWCLVIRLVVLLSHQGVPPTIEYRT